MPNQQLIDFITQQLQKGVLSKEKIKEILLNAGWKEQDIDEAFSLISSPASQPEQPSAPPVSTVGLQRITSAEPRITGDLIEDIKVSLAQKKSKEEIYKELLGKGWTIEVIQDNFNAIASAEAKEDAQKRTIRIIVTIAAVLVGTGIFSFIAANWQEMARPVKVGIIVISMLGSYVWGWYLKEKLNLCKTGEALILLGAIIYGAGIFLVAQMFNIRANWPDGFILWMIGTIAMGFAVESFPLFYLSIPLGIIAIISHSSLISIGYFSRMVGYNPFLTTSSFLLLIATVVTSVAGWIVRKRLPPELKEFY